MDINPADYQQHPIPSIFHSLHDGPFDHCLICGQELLASNTLYLIERIFRDKEPILEYAMCFACHDKLSGELSTESTQRIQQYFSDGLDWDKMVHRSLRMAEAEPEDWISECVLTGVAADQCRERQIYAHCQGDQLLLGGPLLTPMMLSGHVIEELSDLLSEATLGWMEDFVGEHFGMSPDLVDAPDGTPLLL